MQKNLYRIRKQILKIKKSNHEKNVWKIKKIRINFRIKLSKNNRNH